MVKHHSVRKSTMKSSFCYLEFNACVLNIVYIYKTNRVTYKVNMRLIGLTGNRKVVIN